MSQVPTNEDIPSNSQKAKDANKKPEIVPFEGEVAGARRKNSKFWAWMRKMFLSDRKPSEIAMDVLENNIVPGIKDNFRNGLVSSLDMFIYQNSKPANASNPQNNSVSYNNVYRASTTTPAKPQTPASNANNNGVDLSGGFVNPCFRTRDEAYKFLVNKMKAYDYPTLSVHTMYMMMSKHIDYTWDAYGWTKEEVAGWNPDRIITRIQSKDFPWMIDLPQAHVIS